MPFSDNFSQINCFDGLFMREINFDNEPIDNLLLIYKFLFFVFKVIRFIFSLFKAYTPTVSPFFLPDSVDSSSGIPAQKQSDISAWFFTGALKIFHRIIIVYYSALLPVFSRSGRFFRDRAVMLIT